jgi:hypothetical protein
VITKFNPCFSEVANCGDGNSFWIISNSPFREVGSCGTIGLVDISEIDSKCTPVLSHHRRSRTVSRF